MSFPLHCRPCLLHALPFATVLRHTSTLTSATQASAFLTRKLPTICDVLSPQPTHLLSLTLSPFLGTTVSRSSLPAFGTPIHPGHHLVYFPPQLPEELLLPDGSDAEQSPGAPWTRRMWAGGRVEFKGDRGLRVMDRGVLTEWVEKVEQKGTPGSDGEMMFVWFARRIFSEPLFTETGEVGMEAVMERRCLVFLKDRNTKAPMPRVVKPPRTPDWTLTFTPTQHLLFRFSALTFNAHRIHYDTEFSQAQEGYKGTLCHGPMALVLLLELLRMKVLDAGYRVRSIDYRCLAPMYVGQPYTISGRRVDEGMVELWAETPDGGYSVRATAEVERV